MKPLVRQLSDLYGDLRHFGRRQIRDEVSKNALLPAANVRTLSETLFQNRVGDAIRRNAFYSDKVLQHCGSTLQSDAVAPALLPVWTRQDQNDLMMAQSGSPIPGAFLHATGGSTGSPTRFYVTRESYEWRTAVSDRGYSWAGAEEGRKSYYVWGSPIKPLSPLKKCKIELQHIIQRREYFDSFIFNDERKEACCREISRFKPDALVGYAGNLVDLALFVLAHPGKLNWKARSVVTGAEGLQPGQRELLQATLADEVFMSYGSREFMLIGMECREHSGYHISADNLYVEVVDEAGQSVMPGRSGRILVTDLRNMANPFIRYQIGDMGTMSLNQCRCGLPFPLLASVDGRIQEFLYTTSGEKMTALFIPHLLKEFSWVRGYQIVQTDKANIRVNVISDGELTSALTEPMVHALRAKLGSAINVTIVRVAALQKGASGKVPIVIQEVSDSSDGSLKMNQAK